MIRKTAIQNYYLPGEIVEYTIEIINTSNIPINNIEITENLDGGNYRPQDGVILDGEIAKIQTLNAKEKITLIYEYKIPNEVKEGKIIENKIDVVGKVLTPEPDEPLKEITVRDNDKEKIEIEEKKIGRNIGLYKIDEETKEEIEGAIFELYSSEDILIGETVVLSKDELIEKAESDVNGIVRFRTDIPLGKYYIKEISAAPGYEFDDSRIEVDTTKLNDSEKEYKLQVEKTNKQTEIQVLKIEKIEEKEENIEENEPQLVIEKEEQEDNGIITISGAKLQVLDGDTKEVVTEWETEESATIVKMLETEKVYILHEAEPAPGYVTAEDIQFSITKEGTLVIKDEDTLNDYENTIVMQDDITRVKVNLVDEKTKKQLPEGKLEIRDENGEVIITTTTEEIAWEIEKLPIGEYTLVAVEVPEGYKIPEELKFEVKDTNEVQEVTMELLRKPFDLTVEKYISKATVNNDVMISSDYSNRAELKKLEINKKMIKSGEVRIEYTIRITNSGEIDGYIGKITDILPEGLEFVAEENESYWKAEGNVITTDKFAEEEIKAGEYKEIKIVTKWNNSEFGVIKNKVTIENAGNKYEFEDINQENDEGISSIVFTIGTGKESVILNVILLSAIAGVIIYGILSKRKIV